MTQDIQNHFNENRCPDPEVIASFIEGVLAKEDYRRTVTHLASCPSCYSIAASAIHVNRVLEETETLKQPELQELPVFGWRFIRGLTAVLGVMILYLAWQSWTFQKSKETAAGPGMEKPQAAIGPTEKQKPVSLKPFSVYLQAIPRYVPIAAQISERNEVTYGFASIQTKEQAAVRAGMELARLEMGRQSQNPDLIISAKTRIEAHLTSLRVKNDILSNLENIQTSSDSPTDFINELENQMKTRNLSFFFQFGQWLEVGIYAATASDATYFDPVELKKFQDEWKSKNALPGISLNLDRISTTAAGSRPLTKRDFERIRGLLVDIAALI